MTAPLYTSKCPASCRTTRMNHAHAINRTTPRPSRVLVRHKHANTVAVALLRCRTHNHTVSSLSLFPQRVSLPPLSLTQPHALSLSRRRRHPRTAVLSRHGRGAALRDGGGALLGEGAAWTTATTLTGHVPVIWRRYFRDYARSVNLQSTPCVTEGPRHLTPFLRVRHVWPGAVSPRLQGVSRASLSSGCRNKVPSRRAVYAKVTVVPRASRNSRRWGHPNYPIAKDRKHPYNSITPLLDTSIR